MEIHPRYSLRPRYKGEAAVYRLLSIAANPGGFAVHSINLPDHVYKRWAEADFVVVSPAGVTVLEVKGGVVSYVGREWRYENARGQVIRSTEGPARQALSAALALEELLSSQLGVRIRCRWGVVFPLCAFNREIAELPQVRLADGRICNEPHRFSTWLDTLPFDHRSPADFALTADQVEAIRDVLLPEMTAISTLGLGCEAIAEHVAQLTLQQHEILDSLATNPRLTVSGGAGTGKTELAALCAIAERESGHQPVIVAGGVPLVERLRRRLSRTGIPVTSGAIPVGTDTIIVDEGQDFAQPTKFEAMFNAVAGGLETGRWRWFMDPNLQFVDHAPDQICLERLRANSVAVRLTRNVRCTAEILQCVNSFLHADLGISKVDGFGVRVAFHRTEGSADEAAQAARVLESLVDQGVLTGEIVVLGPEGIAGPVGSKIAQLLPTWTRKFHPVDDWTTGSRITVARIDEFRGLESRVVVLVDLDRLPPRQLGRSLLYVAMTRAVASLHVFLSEESQFQFGRMLVE